MADPEEDGLKRVYLQKKHIHDSEIQMADPEEDGLKPSSFRWVNIRLFEFKWLIQKKMD